MFSIKVWGIIWIIKAALAVLIELFFFSSAFEYSKKLPIHLFSYYAKTWTSDSLVPDNYNAIFMLKEPRLEF